ncbi:Peroxisomal membrane 22 kDa family protein [Theobroma cacao]|uniref:Peroxisomal membrane 22 kDa family protein n=1 Tax=Theobroma cacao TaxID=3641 RepID=A0A061E2U8_THECC|nr:Peroxisomal membrane 22 kDa family protein [Theobroma cacao]
MQMCLEYQFFFKLFSVGVVLPPKHQFDKSLKHRQGKHSINWFLILPFAGRRCIILIDDTHLCTLFVELISVIGSNFYNQNRENTLANKLLTNFSGSTKAPPSMATLNSMASHKPSALFEPIIKSHKYPALSPIPLSARLLYKTNPTHLLLWIKKRRNWIIKTVTDDKELAPVETSHSNEAKKPLFPNGSNILEAFSSSSERGGGDDDFEKLSSRAINASIVLGFGTLAVSKLLTIDHDYWHGWTLFEVFRYVPEHNWIAYEQALKANPVLAKMTISGIVYSIGDWIAQCYEGKPLFDFDRTRMFRSGLVGFTLHGSLSHYYYQFCEALFPFQDWWVVPAKVVFDQTVWAAIWNSIYYVVLGFLRFESSANIYRELKATFWPMLTAGWKLWPFAHMITYGVIPVEQRLLWVDCVELIWVTILSTYSNEKSEARILDARLEEDSSSSSNPPKG